MWNKSNSEDCEKYLEVSNWIMLSDLLNEWCQFDPHCKEIKRLAILSACENNEIIYSRNDGKNFDDDVHDLAGRKILIINKDSFNDWKARFYEKENQEIKSPQNLKDFLRTIDDEYISIKDILDVININLDKENDLKKAGVLLLSALSRNRNTPPIYQKNELCNGQEKSDSMTGRLFEFCSKLFGAK